MVDDVISVLGAADHAVPDNDAALTSLAQLHATTGDAVGGTRPRPHPVLGFEQVTAPRTRRYFIENVVPAEGTPAMPSTSRRTRVDVPPPHSMQGTSSQRASQGVSSQGSVYDAPAAKHAASKSKAQAEKERKKVINSEYYQRNREARKAYNRAYRNSPAGLASREKRRQNGTTRRDNIRYRNSIRGQEAAERNNAMKRRKWAEQKKAKLNLEEGASDS